MVGWVGGETGQQVVGELTELVKGPQEGRPPRVVTHVDLQATTG